MTENWNKILGRIRKWNIEIARFIAIIFFFLGTINISWAQDPNKILLKNFRPKSIYKTPQTHPQKAAVTVIDMHSHAYAESVKQVEEWVKNMDECGIEKTIILTY